MNILKNFKEFIGKLRLLYHDWLFLKMFSNDKQRENYEVLFSLLRKDCHVLDKGLHILPFEQGHGKAIYDEAIFLRKRLVGTLCVNDPSYSWCEQVITSYEQAQSGKLGIDDISYHVYNDDERRVLYNFFHSRVSSRYFNDKNVPESIWNEIVEIAADAPNGCCRQTSRVYVVHEKEMIAKLKKNIAGATGFSNGIPYLLCVTADTRPYMCIDRILAYIDASLFTENLVLACRANNIFTTILNFQHASQKQRKTVAEYLSIPDYERVILFIAAGCVDFVPQKPVRMSINQFRKL